MKIITEKVQYLQLLDGVNQSTVVGQFMHRNIKPQMFQSYKITNK